MVSVHSLRWCRFPVTVCAIPHTHLERLPFGQDGFPKRGGGGASAEGGAAQGDLGLPAGDGGGAERRDVLAPGDGGVPQGEFALPPLYAGVAHG